MTTNYELYPHMRPASQEIRDTLTLTYTSRNELAPPMVDRLTQGEAEYWLRSRGGPVVNPPKQEQVKEVPPVSKTEEKASGNPLDTYTRRILATHKNLHGMLDPTQPGGCQAMPCRAEIVRVIGILEGRLGK